MGNWSKTKLLTNLIVVVAVLVIGAGVVMAARGGTITPFTSSSGDSHSAQATDTEQHDQNDQNDHNEFKAHGLIQTITFDQGTTTSGSLDFLPDGQQATVTVTFTAQTHVQVTGGLQTNVAVRIEGTKQSDGSVLAQEINDNAQDDEDNQEDQTVAGVIQSIDTTAQTLVFLPDGQTATLTIAYDQNTNIEDEHSTGPLAAGQHVVVEIVKRADGTLYAKEIKSGQEDGDGHEGNGGGDDNGGSGSGGSGSGGSGSGGSGSGDGSGH